MNENLIFTIRRSFLQDCYNFISIDSNTPLEIKKEVDEIAINELEHSRK